MPSKSGGGNHADLIKMAIDQIDVQIRELNEQRGQLARMVGGGVTAAAAAAPIVRRRRGRPPAKKAAAKSDKPKRKFSLATRKKLRDAAKARWAKIRAEQG